MAIDVYLQIDGIEYYEVELENVLIGSVNQAAH
jgi:hypothetical protein